MNLLTGASLLSLAKSIYYWPRRAPAFINPQPDLAGIEYGWNYEPLYFYPKKNCTRAVCKRV